MWGATSRPDSVAKIVPASFQDQPSGAYSSQLDRFAKMIGREDLEDLREKTKMAEILVGV